MINVENIQVNVEGQEILKGVNLNIGAGEVHGTVVLRPTLQLSRVFFGHPADQDTLAGANHPPADQPGRAITRHQCRLALSRVSVAAAAGRFEHQ